jgi:hypothetical protein
VSQESLKTPLALEHDPVFRANVGFLMMQESSLNIMTNVLSKAMSPSVIISFDSPLSGDDMLLPLGNVERDQFLQEFKKEADFIGYFVFEWKG